MPVMYGQVQAPSNISASDGTNQPWLQGKQNEGIIADLHGKYYTQSYRGNAYIGSSAAGGIIPPIYTTTAQVFGVWNRAGNTRNCVPQVLDVGAAIFAAEVVGSLVLSQSLNAGSALATGQISAFTAALPPPASATTVGTVQGANLGVGANTVAFTGSAATTLAAIYLMSLNYSFFSTAVAALGPNPCLHYDFEGGLIVPPNNAIWLASAPAAQTATFMSSLRWEEPPL
jgi:hypothetical protein